MNLFITKAWNSTQNFRCYYLFWLWSRRIRLCSTMCCQWTKSKLWRANPRGHHKHGQQWCIDEGMTHCSENWPEQKATKRKRASAAGWRPYGAKPGSLVNWTHDFPIANKGECSLVYSRERMHLWCKYFEVYDSFLEDWWQGVSE